MRLGPAPTTSSRHQPRTAHNAASPRPDTRPPPHPRPPPRAPPQTPIATTIHPRDPAETTQRPPPTTAAGGGQAGRHAGWPAGGQIGRGWRRTASGGRRSAVGDRHAGTQTRRRPVRQSQQIARGVERHRRQAAGNRRHGGRRQAACGSGGGLAMVSGAARPPTPFNHPPRHLLHTFPHLSPAKQASGRAETARKRKQRGRGQWAERQQHPRRSVRKGSSRTKKWQGPWTGRSHPKKATRRATNTCRHQKNQGPPWWCTATVALETGPPQPPPPPPGARGLWAQSPAPWADL